jgi:hypothetical protein
MIAKKYFIISYVGEEYNYKHLSVKCMYITTREAATFNPFPPTTQHGVPVSINF